MSVTFPLLDGPGTILKVPTDWGVTFAEWDLEPLTFSPLSVLKEITLLFVKIIAFVTFQRTAFSELKERVSCFRCYEQNVRDRQELHNLITVDGEVPFFEEYEYEGMVGLKVCVALPIIEKGAMIYFQQALPESETDHDDPMVWNMGCQKNKDEEVREIKELSFNEVKNLISSIQEIGKTIQAGHHVSS